MTRFSLLQAKPGSPDQTLSLVVLESKIVKARPGEGARASDVVGADVRGLQRDAAREGPPLGP